jgi:hypothetical protein
VRTPIDAVWGRPAAPADPLDRRSRPVLFAILAAAFLLRIGLAWALPSIHQADEVYQVAEQANRAVHGYGIQSWEFQTASRGALFAMAVKPIFLLDASPWAHQMLIAVLFAALSLIPVWVAFQWAGRLYGLAGGALAAALMATWFESVYFAPKPTPDAVCGYFLLAGIFFARPAAGPRHVFLAGFCLLLALAIRMQIAPAVAVVFVLAGLAHGRAGGPALAAGAACALVFAGALEWGWWGVPFRGHYGYLVMEFVHKASSFFRRESPIFYVKTYVLIYGGALPVIAFLIAAGARRAPILILTALAVIVPFHLIGHKEYRFVIAAVPLLVLLMGLAIAELSGGIRPGVAALVVGGWIVGGVAMSLSDQYRPYWLQDRNHILAFRAIGAQPDACGVALVGIRWWHTPGYSGLGRDIPLYESGREEQEMTALAAAANYIVAGPKSPAPPPPYAEWKAYSRPVEFVYRRPGGCVPDEAAKVRPTGIPTAQ